MWAKAVNRMSYSRAELCLRVNQNFTLEMLLFTRICYAANTKPHENGANVDFYFY